MLPSTDPHTTTTTVRGTSTRFPQQHHRKKKKPKSSCRLLLYLTCVVFVIVAVVEINIVMYLTQQHTEKTVLSKGSSSKVQNKDTNPEEVREDDQKQELEFLSIANAKEQFSLAATAAKRHNAQHAQEFAMAYHHEKKLPVNTKRRNTDENERTDADTDSIALNAKRTKRKQQHEQKLRNEQEQQQQQQQQQQQLVVTNSVQDVPTVAPVPLPPVEQITLRMTPEEIAWIQRRNATYFELFENESNGTYRLEKKHRWQQGHWHDQFNKKHIQPEDQEGPWLDFIIAGHPKTGTTTLVANLGKIAPMKVKDFCVREMTTLLRYLYKYWPDKFPEILDGPNRYLGSDSSLHLRGVKCPGFVSDPQFLLKYGPRYPKTKIIIGMRHPVKWFTSFWNMGSSVVDLYSKMTLCPNIADERGRKAAGTKSKTKALDREVCFDECRCGLRGCGIPVCFYRARLHLPLARMGKTRLGLDELALLAPNDPDGGQQLLYGNITNPVFLYEQSQMNTTAMESADESSASVSRIDYWEALAQFIGVSYIPNEHYHAAHGKADQKTLCTDYYDEFRSKLMEHSYNISVWLEDYLLPVAINPSRPDLVIPNPEDFRRIIQTYKEDPCQRLLRDATSGEYLLKPTLDVGFGPGRMQRIIGTDKQVAPWGGVTRCIKNKMSGGRVKIKCS